ncbi:type VI secretion system tip protein VgrG [Leptolyngbya sp. 15MV]|nr:type VI secretion system tip protein VgrG [Leptolyngbya sp. 15MV]
MAATQDGRVIKIHTPLGKDVLLLRNFSVQEGLSQMFQIVAEVLHEGEVGGETPHIVGPTTLLGKNVTIEVEQRDGTSRFFNGIVNRLEQRNRLERFTVFELSIVPQIWLLTQVKQSRIFQNASVQDILNTVFQQFEKTFRFEGQFPKRNYCVQYRESDFDFASRLMEEEGIYYYFEHKNGSHKVIFGNSQAGHVDCPSKSTISFGLDLPATADFIPIITEWITNYRLLSGKVTLWDHNFQLPHNKLEASKPSRYSIPGKDQLEIYDYPGSYGQRFDGVDRGGGSQDSELQKVFDERVRAADLAMQEIDVQYAVVKGEGVCSSMTAGHRFKFENHPVDEFNKQYVITSMTHSGSQSPDYVTNTTVPQPYSNTFMCIPLGPNSLPFRPMRTTPRPIVHGAQTDASATNLTFATAIGAGSTVSNSNTVSIGRGSDEVRVNGNLRVSFNARFPGTVFINLANTGNDGGEAVCWDTGSDRIMDCLSSIQYKTNIGTLTSGLDLITKLRPVSFEWIRSGKKSIGFIAEEVNEIEPRLATKSKENIVRGVDYFGMSAVLASAVKQQQEQIESLQLTVNEQKNRIDHLTEIICEIKPASKYCRND